MGKCSYHGESIEGASADVAVRKSISPTRKTIEDIGVFYKYLCKRHTYVKIIEELNPKVHKILETSVLEMNHELEAASVEILTEKLFSLKLVSNFSAVHGIKANKTNCFTYARITTPFRIFAEGFKTIE